MIKETDAIYGRIFVSYAHADNALLKIFSSLMDEERYWRTKVWFDGKINPGQVWNDQIQKKLQGSEVVLLLITENFAKSTYCVKEELDRVLDVFDIYERACSVIPLFIGEGLMTNDDPLMSKIDAVRKIQGFTIINPDDANEVRSKCNEILSFIRTKIKRILQRRMIEHVSNDPDANIINENRNRHKIFISLPSTDEGRAMRKLLLERIGKERDRKRFFYETTPPEACIDNLYSELSNHQDREDHLNILKEFIDESFCAIIVGPDEKFSNLLDRVQIEETKRQLNVGQLFFLKHSNSSYDSRKIVGTNVIAFQRLFAKIMSVGNMFEKSLENLINCFLERKVLLVRALEWLNIPNNLVEIERIKVSLENSPVCKAQVVSIDPQNILGYHSYFPGGLIYYRSSRDMEWLAPRQKEFLSARHRGIYFSDPWEEKVEDINILKGILRESDTIIQGSERLQERMDEFLIDLIINSHRHA